MSNHPDRTLYSLALELSKILIQNNFMIATAESCTGGWIAEAITEIPGSSAWFDRGFVSYSNQAKEEMLDVKPETLQMFGAVSKEVALEMAKGALLNSQADITVSVTGIAGPTGGSADKPIGTVWIGYALKDKQQASCHHFEGDRYTIRKKAVDCALHETINQLKSIKYT